MYEYKKLSKLKDEREKCILNKLPKLHRYLKKKLFYKNNSNKIKFVQSVRMTRKMQISVSNCHKIIKNINIQLNYRITRLITRKNYCKQFSTINTGNKLKCL